MAQAIWHLFVDDAELARTTGFDRVVHHPEARGVVIPADRPWETVGVAPQYVERTADGRFIALYTAMWWDLARANEQPGALAQDRAHHMFSQIALAESDDGVSWHKPDLGLVEAPAATGRSAVAPFPAPVGLTRANNLGVPFVVVADLGRYGNVADPSRRLALRLMADPSREQKVGAAWQESPTACFAPALPDFRHDPDWRAALTDAHSSFDPRRHLLHFWDERHQEWVAMEQGVVPHWLPSREVARFASPDLVQWSSMAVLYPDAADSHLPHCYDEPMSLTPFCAEGLVFGLLSWFHSDRTHPAGGPTLDPTAEHPARWPWCRKGTNEMRITVSRDGGRVWDRTASRQAWVPHGAEEDSYDRLVIGGLPPVRVDDEDWFYLQVIDGDHLGIRNDAEQNSYYRDRLPKHQIALYVQRHNRYVSLRAGHHREVLITRPMLVTGRTIHLNLDSSRGQVRLGVAPAGPVPTYDAATLSHAPHLLPGHLLPGLGFDDCPPIRTNSIAHPTAFAGAKDLSELVGTQVHLLIEAVDADLYGFRFA